MMTSPGRTSRFAITRFRFRRVTMVTSSSKVATTSPTSAVSPPVGTRGNPQSANRASCRANPRSTAESTSPGRRLACRPMVLE